MLIKRQRHAEKGDFVLRSCWQTKSYKSVKKVQSNAKMYRIRSETRRITNCKCAMLIKHRIIHESLEIFLLFVVTTIPSYARICTYNKNNILRV